MKRTARSARALSMLTIATITTIAVGVASVGACGGAQHGSSKPLSEGSASVLPSPVHAERVPSDAPASVASASGGVAAPPAPTSAASPSTSAH